MDTITNMDSTPGSEKQIKPDTGNVIESGSSDHIQITAPGELERNFSLWSALGLAFAMLNSWTAMSASYVICFL